MPRLIKDGTLQEDRWLPVDPDAEVVAPGSIATLEQWISCPDKKGSAVQVGTADELAPLYENLDDIALIAIHFSVFTDGRGFSHARDLRERGFKGELRATGMFIRDQLTYMRRVGFDAFAMEDQERLESATASLSDFSEHYQAAYDQPLPLFRRR